MTNPSNSLAVFTIDGTEDGGERCKPVLAQLAAHFKAKGVAFELCSEIDGAEHLATANNYLRAASYRKLYPVCTEG